MLQDKYFCGRRTFFSDVAAQTYEPSIKSVKKNFSCEIGSKQENTCKKTTDRRYYKKNQLKSVEIKYKIQ